MTRAVTLNHTKGQVYSLVFDLPDEKVNKLSSMVFVELEQVLDQAILKDDIGVLLIRSGKKNNFIAGADINEIKDIRDSSKAFELAEGGKQILRKIERLPFPTVAVIDGTCMGGGLELALACTYRVVTDDPSTKLALPEVNLGIIPGLGGTQRLPRLVGIQKALDLILTGRSVNGKKALRMHLADALFHREYLDTGLMGFVDKILSNPKSVTSKRQLQGTKNLMLEKNPMGRSLIFKTAAKNVIEKTKNHYPAPLLALDVVKKNYTRSLDRALLEESKAFADIAPSQVSKNLIKLFFTSQKVKSLGKHLVRPVKQVGILGAGIMGGLIGWLFNYKEISVLLKDISWDALSKGFQSCRKAYNYFLKKRKMSRREVELKMLKMTGQVDYIGFKQCDLVIEAVPENLDLKKKVLADLEDHVAEDTIIATNTSSLSVSDMAVALKNPERFVGMHFFNPVNRMPLVEVVAGNDTAKEVVDQVYALVLKLGKTPVVVKDCPGFLVNRILLPYMNEAAHLLVEGASIKQIDDALEAFGMPMGPLALLDEVGHDTAVKVSTVFENHYGERMKTAAILHTFRREPDLLGKKSKKGIYIYKKDKKEINGKIQEMLNQYRLAHSVTPRKISSQEIIDRCIMAMINESVRCLQEGVVENGDILDFAIINGTGFPPFRGGPINYAEELGFDRVCERLEEYVSSLGVRFKPCELLCELSKSNASVNI
ncbi:fatty-acid oxidation protein subunit alpha [Puteibacter caeruleilacunae]|nr:fatty-acid oxidation protein subunit alpha [Puteibacter caeruleilacunae]